LRSINFCLIVLLVLAIGYTVVVAKPILLPLLLAFLMTLVLSPVQRLLVKFKFPGPLAAAFTVFLLLGATVAGLNSLAMPAAEWGDTLDLENAEKQIRELFAPVQKLQEGLSDAARKVDAIADGESLNTENSTGEAENGKGKGESTGLKSSGGDAENSGENEKKPEPVSVVIKERPESELIIYAQSFGLHFIATLLLIFFFLAYGTVFQKRLAESANTERLVKKITTEVSRFLFTISAINLALGACIALSMWILGMPNPLLWGVMGALSNFIPYLGAVAGSIVVFLVAAASFSEPGQVILVPLVYFGLTALEGNVINPMVIGRRFALNPIIVVIWFMCWGAVWGIAGRLVATPTLMVFKIVCANVPGLSRIDSGISP